MSVAPAALTPARAQEYRGFEALLALPDKERDGAGALGWDGRRMRRLLGRLGDPQGAMRCTVVAGSKGKGSTATFLEACLRADGRRTGLYTQPHLHRYAERIRVDGRPVPAERSRSTLAEVLAAAPGPLTAFEAATACALLLFLRAGVAEAVLEVGFGGRLDAVAECDPSVVLLCPIEREHADILGPDLQDVAAHELALCRYGRVCFAAPQSPVVQGMLAARLRSQGCEGGVVAAEVEAASAARPAAVAPAPAAVGRRWCIPLPGGGAVATSLGLAGPFQRTNACLAAAGARALGCGPRAIAAGLASARWPGRWERIGSTPEVIVDGAHTPLSALAVREAVAERGARPRLALVVGLLTDKDARGFAAALAPLGPAVWATQPGHPRAMPADEAGAAFRAQGLPVTVTPRLPRALAAARAWAGREGLVVVTGSLHLVAEARSLRQREAPASGVRPRGEPLGVAPQGWAGRRVPCRRSQRIVQ